MVFGFPIVTENPVRNTPKPVPFRDAPTACGPTFPPHSFNARESRLAPPNIFTIRKMPAKACAMPARPATATVK